MSNSAQKDNKPNVAKTEGAKSRGATRMPPGAALPQMAPPPQLVALQRVMQGHVATEPPVQRDEVEGSTNRTGLSDGLKAGVEKLSGVSLDNVRVHYNSDKPAQVGAQAYTKGTEIHVAPGKESSVPHEAWHAVQQLQGRVEPNAQFKGSVPGNDDKGLEDEADRMGSRALQLSRQEFSLTGSLSDGNIATSVVQRVHNGGENGASEEQEEEDEVGGSTLEPEEEEEDNDDEEDEEDEEENLVEDVEESRENSTVEYWAQVMKLDEERQIRAMRSHKYGDEFMRVALETDEGFALADKIIRMPKISKTFIAAAIKGRYGININTGQWPRSQLRSFWNSFKLVPREHIQGQVTNLEGVISPESSYKSGVIKMSRLIPRGISMGKGDTATRILAKHLMKRSTYSNRMRRKNAFTMVTLHEMGHAVDAKFGIMARNGYRPEFAGWVAPAPNDIFTKYWDGVQNVGNTNYSPEAQTKQQLAAQEHERHEAFAHVVGSSTPEARTKVQGSLKQWQKSQKEWATAKKNEEDAHWEARIGVPKSIFDKLGQYLTDGTSIKGKVAEYVPIKPGMSLSDRLAVYSRRSNINAAINGLAPTRMLKHGRLKNMAWNVDRRAGQTLSAEFGGKVFHESYENEWVGYDINAKDDGVSHYQFRAPAEFFAELYAHYYLDTLTNQDKTQKHPLYDFMEREVAGKPEAQPQQMVERGEVNAIGSSLLEGGLPVPILHGDVELASGDETPAPERPPLGQQTPAIENQETK